MEFDLTPEQLSLQKAAIDFARAELSSGMIERDADRVFSHEGWKKCAAFGVHGLPIPEEFGGSGSDPVTTIAVMEGLGYGSPDQGLLFSINAHMWTNSIPLLIYGTGEQKQKLDALAKINVDQSRLFAYFLSKLDGIREADATLLDRSLILYGSNLSVPTSLIVAGRGGVIRPEDEREIRRLLPSIVITSNSFVVSSLGAHTPAKTCGAGLEENPDPNGDV